MHILRLEPSGGPQYGYQLVNIYSVNSLKEIIAIINSLIIYIYNWTIFNQSIRKYNNNLETASNGSTKQCIIFTHFLVIKIVSSSHFSFIHLSELV